MFVVQERLNENFNQFIYDSPLPKVFLRGNRTERLLVRFSIVLATLRATGAYINFFDMQEEKENVISPAMSELLHHLRDFLPITPDELSEKRELLRDFYLEWFEAAGIDYVPDERRKAKNLFWFLDETLKSLGKIDVIEL